MIRLVVISMLIVSAYFVGKANITFSCQYDKKVVKQYEKSIDSVKHSVSKKFSEVKKMVKPDSTKN